MNHPVKAIAAMSRNRVIGEGNTIPWRIPEDFRFVKKMTLGHVLLMGRKTFESIGKALPGRSNLVLSRTAEAGDCPGATVIRDVDAVDALGLAPERILWIFGGAEIYRQFLPRCDELYLTVVKRDVNGDTFFPPFEDQFTLAEVIRDEAEFEIRRYTREQ